MMILRNQVRFIHHWSRKLIKEIIYLEFQIDLPGIENYGFEGESSFMKCTHGAVASDSEEASKVGRYSFLSINSLSFTYFSLDVSSISVVQQSMQRLLFFFVLVYITVIQQALVGDFS